MTETLGWSRWWCNVWEDTAERAVACDEREEDGRTIQRSPTMSLWWSKVPVLRSFTEKQDGQARRKQNYQ